jgi:hypothetical protein
VCILFFKIAYGFIIHHELKQGLFLSKIRYVVRIRVDDSYEPEGKRAKSEKIAAYPLKREKTKRRPAQARCLPAEPEANRSTGQPSSRAEKNKASRTGRKG